jgi:hypothetical protein
MAINYQIKLGDCIFCIIHQQYLLPETVWKHSNNALLLEKRQKMKNLLPGDVVFILDVRPKEVGRPTDQVHKFYMNGEKHLHWIEIELVGEDDKPIPNEKYKVVLPDGGIKEGNLDQNGWARVEGDPAGQCEVTFPELDKDAWKFIEAIGQKALTS